MPRDLTTKPEKQKPGKTPRRSNLPPGPGPGRPKGVPNKATQAAKEFAEGMLDEAWAKKARIRIREGKAPHLETLMAHYRWGKPKETVAVEAPESLSTLLQLAIQGKRGD